MERVIKEPIGWSGLMVQVRVSESFLGEYEVGIYYRGWVGTMSSEDGMGWSGVGIHGTEQELKAVMQTILDGIGSQRPNVEQIASEHIKKVLEEASND